MKEMNERELAFRGKAQEFLNQKARVKHYRISGVFNEEYGDGDTWAIFEYTDEEVARLKHLFSEALVSYLNLPNKEYSLEEIKEEILKNMQEQVPGVDEWATNMKELARRGIDEGLLQSLMEMGPQGAGYVKAFVDMTDEELQEANRLFSEATKLSENTIYDIEENYREVGQYAADGLAAGIEDNKARAQDAVKEMSLDTIHSAKKELRIQSPSKEFEEIGEYIPLGMQSGILKNKKAALDAATQSARDIINAVNSLIKVETFAGYGKRSGNDKVM